MIINKEKLPILKLIELFKANQPYTLKPYAEIMNEKPINDRPVNYSNETVLIFNGKADQCFLIDYRLDANTFVNLFKTIISTKDHKNRYICNNVANKFISKNVSSIKHEWLHEMSDQQGMFHMGNNSFIYDIKTIDTRKYFHMYLFYSDITFIGGEVTAIIDTSGVHNIKSVGIFNDKEETREFINEYGDPLVITPLLTLFLLEFSEIETKYIDAKVRKIKINGEKIMSTSSIGMEIVDSSYYTNIIRKEGFDVTGHFRWQRIGEGRKNQKLTWVKDFKKGGYERKAKVKENKHLIA